MRRKLALAAALMALLPATAAAQPSEAPFSSLLQPGSAGTEGIFLVLDENVENSAYARTLAVDVVDSKGNVLAAGGTDVRARRHAHDGVSHDDR